MDHKQFIKHLLRINRLQCRFLVVLLTICALHNTTDLTGQSAGIRSRSLFLEIAGSGGLGSLNYEKNFFEKNKVLLNWRAGFSIAPIDKNNGTGLVFPLMIHALLGKTAHKFEGGLGQGITITTKAHFFALTTASVGYRYQSDAKRVFYRIAYTPLISYLVDFQVQHWAGVSIGYTFNK